MIRIWLYERDFKSLPSHSTWPKREMFEEEIEPFRGISSQSQYEVAIGL